MLTLTERIELIREYLLTREHAGADDPDVLALRQRLLRDAQQRVPQLAEVLRGVEDDLADLPELARSILAEHRDALKEALITEYLDAPYLSVSEIAERTGLSARYVRDEIERGNLLAVRDGTGPHRVRSDEYHAWVDNPRRGSRSRAQPKRSGVIDSYYALQDVLSDFERGRIEQQQVVAAYREYAQACRSAGERAYPFEEVVSDDLPAGYPESVDPTG